MLVDRPGFRRIKVAGIGERDHAGKEKQDVERQVDGRLGPRREETVDHVAAHMPVLGERVGAGHHEERAVHHDHDIEGPGARAVERIAREHFPADVHGERHDEPGKRLPHPGADLVDEKQYLLHTESLQENSHPARAGWLFQSRQPRPFSPRAWPRPCQSRSCRPCGG